MDLPLYLRIQARANRLSNRRLHEALRTLTRDDFNAPRTSFFPSLAQTLSPILADDGAALATRQATIYGAPA